MDIIVLKKSDDQVEEFCFPHGEVDGIGAFLKLHSKTEKLQVKTKMRRKRPWYHYLVGFLMYTKRLPFRSRQWKKFDKNWRSKGVNQKPKARAFIFMSLDQTQKLKEISKNSGVSLNSHLLFHLNRVLAPLQEKGKSVWLIPVSTRSTIDEEAYKNEVGFTDAYCLDSSSSQSLDKQIKKRIKNLEHLGGVVGVSLGVFIGSWLLKKLVHLNKYLQIRTGVFTNLGEGSDTGSTVRYCGFPPVIETQPVGALAGIWNGALTLSIHFHPALEISKEQAETFLEQWVASALNS